MVSPPLLQPQDYEICVGLADSGRVLSGSYLHNMLIPAGDALHRFSMGVCLCGRVLACATLLSIRNFLSSVSCASP